MIPRLTYVVPAHNEEKLLRRNIQRLVERLARRDGSRVAIVENGSTDRTWEIVEELRGQHGGVRVEGWREVRAGLGYAYDRALRELEASTDVADPSHVVALSAADLPFGFSDLDHALSVLTRSDAPSLVLGSKAHPESVVTASPQRRAASIAYRHLRRAILGMRVRDCQGTIFIRADVAFALRPHVVARGYFYTTELVFLALQRGERLLEVPVTLEPSERKSTVRLAKDSLAMGYQLLALRARAGHLSCSER